MITRIINLSLSEGTFPDQLKTAIVRPSLKKPSLDPEEMGNYRPIANLSFISKLLERTAAAQLNTYLSSNSLQETNQSAYRSGHSTETALLHVYDDIICAMGERKVVLFVMIDLSAAFDTIDIEILQRTLHHLGIRDKAAQWFCSYMTQRMQRVKVNNMQSTATKTRFGVPQGSVLGPILFTLYMTSLGRLLRHHQVRFHCYADDTQLWIPCEPLHLNDAIRRMESCLSDVQQWMSHFQLKMNCAKTEYLVIRSHRLTRDFKVFHAVAGADIFPSTSAVKNLGILTSCDMSLDAHVSSLSRACFAHLKNISRIKKHLDQKTLEIVVHTFVTNKLDYCNSLLLGAPSAVLGRIQRIQNAAARLLTDTALHAHITPVLRELHWLPVEKRVLYKVVLLVFKIINGAGPSYLLSVPTNRDASAVRTLRSNNCNVLNVPFTTSTIVFNRSFTYAAPRIWNTLPHEMRVLTDLDVFKKQLKTFLFNAYFS